MTCGKWKLVQEIGRGAYGVVHMAKGACGERTAVKVCCRDVVGDECYARELRGAKLFKSIPPQEGLVRMRDLVETDWGFYAVLDLADDEFCGLSKSLESYRPKTLARVIAGEKALPLKECIKLAISLANGLSALQRHHLLHRDIKPGNVIYVGGRPVLADPGLIIEESDAVSLVGTPGYVPPEKFTDAASDIYSLGLTLKAASFGRQVDELDKGPSMEADTGAACFPAWWRILNKATDPVASRRYQSAKALLKDIQALRLKMLLASKTLGLPRYAWFLIAVITTVMAASAFRVKSAVDYSESRWKEQDEQIAQEVARAKATNARIIQDLNDSFLKEAKDKLVGLENEIAEIEQSIAADEKCLVETDWKGDFSSKRRMENGIRDHRNYLTNYLLKAKASAVERVEKLKRAGETK